MGITVYYEVSSSSTMDETIVKNRQTALDNWCKDEQSK